MFFIIDVNYDVKVYSRKIIDLFMYFFKMHDLILGGKQGEFSIEINFHGLYLESNRGSTTSADILFIVIVDVYVKVIFRKKIVLILMR